jgi:hypothetical protein
VVYKHRWFVYHSPEGCSAGAEIADSQPCLFDPSLIAGLVEHARVTCLEEVGGLRSIETRRGSPCLSTCALLKRGLELLHAVQREGPHREGAARCHRSRGWRTGRRARPS